MSRIRAIVFDLDDTLYPERQFVFSGYQAVAEAFHEPLAAPFDLVARMKRLFDSPDRGRVFDVIAAECKHPNPAALVSAMIGAYRDHQPKITLLPDAESAIVRFRGRFRLGIISDGPLQTQANKVDALKLRSRIDEIILTDTWGREFWKPHHRAFAEMASRLDVSPSECLYIADNPSKDFLAPNALGWQSVQVLRDDGIYADRVPPETGRPTAIVDSLDSIDPATAC